jgi:hypothetical protein
MTNTAEHEMSTFALDLYWASGRPDDAAIEQHLARCARCTEYLRALDSVGAIVSHRSKNRAPPSPRWLRWAAPAAGAMAIAAGVALFLRSRREAADGYVGLKGTPAVEVLVHRGSETKIWDERSPVQPGDALALRVACEGLTHAAVLSPKAKGWTRLSEAPCPRDPDSPLPFTLRVDGEPGEEELAVVLSRDGLDEDGLRAAARTRRRDAGVWVVRFTLPKDTEGGR